VITNLGDYAVNSTVYVPFHTFDSNDPSASVTLTGLAVTDIEIYKAGGTTQRASDSGYTLLDTDGIDFDAITGLHGFSIDTSDNTDAGFFAAGGEYWVAVSSVTVDGATINFWAAVFTIERAGGALALLKGTNSLADIEGKIDTLDTVADGIKTVTDNLPNSGALNDLAAILTDTGTTLPATLAALNDLSAAEVNTQADTALTDFFTSAAQLVDDIWDEVISKAAHNVSQSAAKLVRHAGDISQIDGAVSDASPATTGFNTNLTQADGYFDDAVMVFSNGSANAGIGMPISTYLNANGAVTFVAPDDWPVTPVNGDDFVIYATHVHPVSQIQSGLATAANLATVDTVVDAIKTVTDAIPEGGALTTLSADAARLTAARAQVLTDWIDGGRLDLLIDAITTSIAALNDISASDVLTTQMTESYAADGVAPTIAQALMMIQQILTELSISGTTGTIKKLDGSTTAATLTLDDATDPTSITRAT